MEKLLFLPVNASEHGYQIDQLIILMHVLMFALFVGWGTFFVITLLRFHKKRNPKANYHGVQNHVSTCLEVGVAVVEALLLVGLSIPFWSKIVNALPPADQAVTVRVVAEQFAWNIHYPGKDGVFGRTSTEWMDSQNNPLGLDRKDPHAADDVTTINQLHLPVNKPAILYLSSKDVIHSFFLPIMRVKQDVIPGMIIPTWFTPTETGASEIGCAQLCGLGHYRMKGYLTVHTQKDFDAWLQAEHDALSSSGGEDDAFWN